MCPKEGCKLILNFSRKYKNLLFLYFLANYWIFLAKRV